MSYLTQQQRRRFLVDITRAQWAVDVGKLLDDIEVAVANAILTKQASERRFAEAPGEPERTGLPHYDIEPEENWGYGN
jgi:hypothetical protein